MGQRRFHYEKAFEHYLRANRVPVVVTDESRKALFPVEMAGGTDSTQPHKFDFLPDDFGPNGPPDTPCANLGGVKSFDFLLTGPQRHLIVDVKGRRLATGHQQNWVTRDDIDALKKWQAMLGGDYQAVFVFAYFSEQQPPDTSYEQAFLFENRWYGLVEIAVDTYEKYMRPRSRQWDTVCLAVDDFRRIARPFSWKNIDHNRKASDRPRTVKRRRKIRPFVVPRGAQTAFSQPSPLEIVAGMRTFANSSSASRIGRNWTPTNRVRRSSLLVVSEKDGLVDREHTK